jgi:hypothetical protein
MLQINPLQEFPIIRVLTDHTDTDTNYVRAVVKDAKTLVTLATLNLTDNGNRVFSKLWTAPVDNAYSNGRFILITTSVYTDSGYTTKNPNYAEEAETYLVQQRWEQQFAGGGGGGGPSVEQLRKLLKELKDGETPPPLGAAPANDPNRLADAILTRIENAIAIIPKPETPEKFDLSRVYAAIEDVSDEVRSLPEPVKPDFQPVLTLLRDVLKTQNTNTDAIHDLTVAVAQLANNTLVLNDDTVRQISAEHDRVASSTAKSRLLNKLKAKYA